jgi:hypothetical protein
MESEMMTQDSQDSYYYHGPERRAARKPRRNIEDRRYRHRNESIISDFRNGEPRRQEDAEGFVEINGLYPDVKS